MIHYYKFKNFYSFADETLATFILPKAAPKNNLSCPSKLAQNGRVSKVISAFGANASGKTTLLKPLAFLAWFASESFSTLQPETRIPIEPHFAFNNEPSEFVIEFELAQKLYRYELIITQNKVLFEALRIKSSSKFKYIFERTFKKNKYEIKQRNFDFNQHEAEKVRPNASLISTAAQYQNSIALEFKKYLNNSSTNLTVLGRTASNAEQLLHTAFLYEQNLVLKEKMIKIMKIIDLGLEDIEIVEQLGSINLTPGISQVTNTKLYVPYGIHQSHGKRYRINFFNESSGTRSAFIMLYRLLYVLEYGGVAVIDELEQDFHPQLLEYILNLFFKTNSNPYNAQIIFTCHAHEIMNLLDKTQIMLLEKDEDCQSHAWRLDDIKGVRRDENWHGKYQAGAYGATPNLG